jgi:acyl-CoA thioester hydrolase
VEQFRARWADMDFNQHMRNAADLGCSEETRIGYMDQNGWTMDEFSRYHLGPVVLEDRLVYKKEIRLHESFQVELWLAGSTSDGRRFKVRNQFFRTEDGVLCAVVESFILWLDLVSRKPIVPPAELQELWMNLAHTDDFENLD